MNTMPIPADDIRTDEERIADFQKHLADHVAAGCESGNGKSAWIWKGGEMTSQCQCQRCGTFFTPLTPKQTRFQ